MEEVTLMKNVALIGIGCFASFGTLAQESLEPLRDGKAPQTFEAAWAGCDPRSEPLDVEVLKEWEHEGVILKVLRYRIGVFKGQKAMMAAVYGFPKGGMKLPGLVQIHGGGQYADYRAPLNNAKRGYATISIAWAGRISAPDYTVNPDGVALFWAGKTNDPSYRVTTDWGALDGYHAPCRNPQNDFPSARPAAWTLDAMESPRNSPWFLCALGARRALTFLEQQPEVDKNLLGVYGHSMGGKLTVMTAAADARVKAAAPSCGGISDRDNASALFRAAIGDDACLKRITCPIIFLSPANDFHGHVDDLPAAVAEIHSREWRIASSPHLNHVDIPEGMVAMQLWMDQHLKGTFAVPQTPQTKLVLGGVPSLAVKPDTSKPVLAVDVYYTQQAEKPAADRFWHHAAGRQEGDTWTAALPLLSVDRPLWVYANVRYALDALITGADYYYGTYTTKTYTLSSLVQQIAATELRATGVKATLRPSLMIETFAGDWQKEWFARFPDKWPRSTRKLNDEQYAPPPFAKLALEVRTETPGQLVLGLDNTKAMVTLPGDPAWQTILLYPIDFTTDKGEGRSDWKGIKEFQLGEGSSEHWRQGPVPQFRNLRWVAGTQEAVMDGTSADMWGKSDGAKTNLVRGAWLKDSRFAMFVHWGLYSEIAGKWDGKTYYGIAEWIMRRAQIPVADYEQVATRFNPTNFNATEWVQLAKDTGMRHMMITAKHHDGFAMFKSSVTPYNIVDATPFRRDPMRELSEACRAGGVRLGFYYSQTQDWHERDAVGNDWEFKSGAGDFQKYLDGKAIPQIKELLSNYGPIAGVWFDTPGPITPAQSKDLVDLVHLLQPKALVNSRIGNGLGDYDTMGDQEIPKLPRPGLWETPDTANDTWAYAWYDRDWKSPLEIAERLVRVVSRGGTYMLNVGPDGTGRIPEQSARILREVGKWVHAHESAIHGAEPTPFGPLAWGECTAHGDTLFLHVFQWPADGRLIVPGLKTEVRRASLEGDKLSCKTTGQTLVVTLPANRPDTLIPVVELELAGPAEAARNQFVLNGCRQPLETGVATLKNCEIGKVNWMEKFGDWKHAECLIGWKGPESSATWTFHTVEPGSFFLDVEYTCPAEDDYSEWQVTVDGQRLTFPLIDTGERVKRKAFGGTLPRFRTYRVGVIDFPKPGTQQLAFGPTGADGKDIRVTALRLSPVE